MKKNNELLGRKVEAITSYYFKHERNYSKCTKNDMTKTWTQKMSENMEEIQCFTLHLGAKRSGKWKVFVKVKRQFKKAK